jgi:hypothetical protein
LWPSLERVFRSPNSPLLGVSVYFNNELKLIKNIDQNMEWLLKSVINKNWMRSTQIMVLHGNY